MLDRHITAERSLGWMGLERGHRARPLEWVAEKLIFLVSLSAIVMIFLIFIFVGREALPIILGQANLSSSQKVLPAADLEKLSPAQLRQYLGLTSEEFANMDRAALKDLMQLKVETAKEGSTDKDAALNTTSWRYILFPHRWTDYDKPVFIWQPISQIAKYNIIPLIIGSLKTATVSLLLDLCSLTALRQSRFEPCSGKSRGASGAAAWVGVATTGRGS